MSEINLLIQELRDTIDNQREEIDRLNNIINELEKSIKEENDCYDVVGVSTRILDKLKALKENNK